MNLAFLPTCKSEFVGFVHYLQILKTNFSNICTILINFHLGGKGGLSSWWLQFVWFLYWCHYKWCDFIYHKPAIVCQDLAKIYFAVLFFICFLNVLNHTWNNNRPFFKLWPPHALMNTFVIFFNHLIVQNQINCKIVILFNF